MAKVKSGVCQVTAAPSENLHLSVSCAEITVQFHDSFRICQQRREESWLKQNKKMKGEAIGSMEYHLVCQWKVLLSEGGVWPAQSREGREVNKPDRIISGSVRVSNVIGPR